MFLLQELITGMTKISMLGSTMRRSSKGSTCRWIENDGEWISMRVKPIYGGQVPSICCNIESSKQSHFQYRYIGAKNKTKYPYSRNEYIFSST